MTDQPRLPPFDPFSDEERELALRLARLDTAAGPSASLDARILAAARATAAPARRARRWPGAVGAAAVLVAAVGLAWQLRPMFQLPPPSIEHAEDAGSSGRHGADSETVVQIERVPRAPQPVADTGNQAATDAPAAAPRRAPSVAGGTSSPARTPTSPRAVAKAHSPEFVDEALPALDRAAPAVAASPPPPEPAATLADSGQPNNAPMSRRASTTPSPDISADARLPAARWLDRIRERRDAGDIVGARASLARFVASHPRLRVPKDLRPLLRDDDPWSR